MKPFTHPKKNITLIQRKDGRTYSKSWVFFRKIVRNDNDEKIWNAYKTQSFFNQKSKNYKNRSSITSKKTE